MVSQQERKQRASAFTLIELLVVIAIIAILAAILFPVFAKARESARGASSQSNQKQISLAILMYVQDYDETYPIHQRWGDPSSPLVVGGTPWSSWAYDIAPYIKNRQIFVDPLAGPSNTSDIFYPYRTTYGYNHTVLSPSSSQSLPWRFIPVSLAAVARPADTVLTGGMFSPDEVGGVYWGGPQTMTAPGGLDPPDCADIVPWCFSDWSATGGWSSIVPTEEAGKYTGGVSCRKALNMNFSHCDGHVKFMRAGQGAIGTNWFKGIGANQVHITNPAIYKFIASP